MNKKYYEIVDTKSVYIKDSYMKKLLLSVFVFIALTSCSEKQVRIACVGDSITEGAGIMMQSTSAYPVVLEQILGKQTKVLNSGKSATVMQKEGDFPYWNTKEFSNLFAFNPNIVVIKLGTNDSKPQNWNRKRFEKDYQSLIDTINTMLSRPKILLCLPVPVFQSAWGINDSTLVAGVIPAIQQIAKNNQLETIDLNTPMKNKEIYFPDKIHPNEEGAKIMAGIVADKIKMLKILSQ
jgi:alpha-L-fucosidase 2